MKTENEICLDIRILAGPKGMDPRDDNVDVEVVLPDQRRFSGTFFTRRNIDSLFKKNADSGECNSGLYFWAADLIVVDYLSEEVIRRTILDLIQTGEFESAFGELNDDIPP